MSLYEWDLVMPARWVGAANYRALVSTEFWEVVTNTVKYSVGVVVLSQTLGLGLAVLLNFKIGRARRTARSSIAKGSSPDINQTLELLSKGTL